MKNRFPYLCAFLVLTGTACSLFGGGGGIKAPSTDDVAGSSSGKSDGAAKGGDGEGAPSGGGSETGTNPIQQKYVSREGGTSRNCEPTGVLKEIIEGKYKCYAAKGADHCPASIDAAKGTLEPKYLELYGDLLKTDKNIKRNQINHNGFLYASGCEDMRGADFAHFLAIGGVGYAKATAHLDALLALGAPDQLSEMGADPRSEVIASLGRFGEPQKDKILPILKNAIAAKGSILGFKKNALKLMARFNSDDGVSYCLDVFKAGNDKDVTKVCAWYLAERKNADVAPLLVRRYDEEKLSFGRALGLLGAKEAVDVLKADYEKQAGSAVALPATVALLNIGDKSYDYAADLVLMLQGKRPLSLKDREKKAKELADKKKGAEEKWKQREEEVQEDIARAAAIESTYVTDAASAKKINDALKATSKKTDWVKASALATSALAQRGEKTAIADLVKLLGSPKKEAREIALNAFGSRYDQPEAFLEYVGRKGVVADATVPPALFKFIESEPDEATRVNALLAVGSVRSFL